MGRPLRGGLMRGDHFAQTSTPPMRPRAWGVTMLNKLSHTQRTWLSKKRILDFEWCDPLHLSLKGTSSFDKSGNPFEGCSRHPHRRLGAALCGSSPAVIE